jgi:hypothetical protein
MPLQSLKLPAPLYLKMRKKIHSLIEKNNLNDSEKIDASYDLGFCMHIQIVPKKQFDSLFFGKPEGIRAFIQSGTTVFAAADFVFAGKKLKLSYMHQGQGLNVLLTTLNKLEKKYAGDKEIMNAELIYFLLAPGPYILIKSDKKNQFYYATAKKLSPVTLEGLKKQVNKILVQRLKTR